MGGLLHHVPVLGGQVIYHLLFHPLSKFPGPKLAAAKGWYESYFDLWVEDGGQFIFEIKRLHQKYGQLSSLPCPRCDGLLKNGASPVVRIKPHELHIDDPDWLSTLYTSSVK